MEIINTKLITLLRELRGYSQTELASQIDGITQTHLSALEKGKISPRIETLNKIAHALNVPVEYFGQSGIKANTNELYFRKQNRLSGKKLGSLKALISVVCGVIDKLFSNIETNTAYTKLQLDVSNGWTPESAAQAIRKYLGVAQGPIENIFEKIESVGILIFGIDWESTSEFGGLATFSSGGIPIIFYNKNMPNDRIRMTLAHELCHLCLHLPFIIESYREEEKEAFKFAAEFLMPAKEINRDLIFFSFYDLLRLKENWLVSKSALIRRAKELGNINADTYSYMNIELGRVGERVFEKGFVAIDEPTLLAKVIKLYNDNGYNTQDLADLVYLTLTEFEKVFLGIKYQLKFRNLIPKI